MTRRLASTLRFSVAAALAAGMSVGLAGCLVSSRSSSSVTGDYVGSDAFEEVEVGVTTDEWLIAALGAPTSSTTLDSGAQVWKWSHTKTSESSGSVLFLFGGSSSHVTAGATCVELCDGVVVKKWRD